jgi:hypothetical protein
MCDPVTMTFATIQAVGSMQQGKAAKAQAYGEAGQMDYQAAVERDNAAWEARSIRREGEGMRGDTLSSVAAAGIKIGEGSALDAERQVMQDYAEDEAMALLNGERRARALNESARQTRSAGRAAKRGSYFTAATSLLSAGAQGLRAQQAPAPIVNRDIRG